jgi:hypothetical protein
VAEVDHVPDPEPAAARTPQALTWLDLPPEPPLDSPGGPTRSPDPIALVTRSDDPPAGRSSAPGGDWREGGGEPLPRPVVESPPITPGVAPTGPAEPASGSAPPLPVLGASEVGAAAAADAPRPGGSPEFGWLPAPAAPSAAGERVNLAATGEAPGPPLWGTPTRTGLPDVERPASPGLGPHPSDPAPADPAARSLPGEPARSAGSARDAWPRTAAWLVLAGMLVLTLFLANR